MGNWLDGGLGSAVDEAYQGVAGIGDATAGDIDESVGRTTDSLLSGDWAGAGDAAAGSFDEAFGEMTSGDLAGIGDGLAGSFDEAVGEMTSGDLAGVFDGALGGLDEATGQFVQGGFGVLDAAGGSVDESIGRQFDDQEGGGFGDLTINWTADAADDAWTWTADVAGDAARDLDPLTPGWFDWITDNQEIVVGLLAVLAFAYATEGTIGTSSGS